MAATASLWSLFRGRSSQDLWDSAKYALIEKVSITQNEIGRGSYGVVYDAVYGGTQCVAKEIHDILIGEGINNNVVVESFIKEINILSTLRHPNIVYFFGVHFRDGSQIPVLIVERMWMSLGNLLEEQSSIPPVIKVHILHDVACGLKFLHNQDPPVMHRDLTANNILVSKNMEAKITDLGLAKALEAISKEQLSTAPGNTAHMPPEALQSKPEYSTKLDIFSFGCVSLHVLTQQFPMPISDRFESSQENKETFIMIHEWKRRQEYVKMIKVQYAYLVDLILSCIKNQPEYRPDADHVCKWIENYWDKPEMKRNCSESLIDYCKQDKISLITSLEQQTTRAKDMESTVKQYQSHNQELTNSIKTKEEHISLLEKQYSDLQRSMESQQLENERLRSQVESFQQDALQQTDNEIIMSLNTMLQQEQEDMREKRENIRELRRRLNNLEQTSTQMRREGEKREEELRKRNAQLQALHQKKEVELNKITEMIKNEKGSLVYEKEHLQREVQDYCTKLQRKDDEIKELKAKLNEQSANIEKFKLQCKSQVKDSTNSVSSENEQISSLSLQQEQKDMREKQEEIRELKRKLNNLEQTSTQMRREGERREDELQKGNAKLQALQKKEAELNENIERIKNENGILVNEKEHLQREVQDYCTNLQRKDDEINELKARLANTKELHKSQMKELTDSVSSKDEKIFSLEKQNSNLQGKIQHEEEICIQTKNETAYLKDKMKIQSEKDHITADEIEKVKHCRMQDVI